MKPTIILGANHAQVIGLGNDINPLFDGRFDLINKPKYDVDKIDYVHKSDSWAITPFKDPISCFVYTDHVI